MNRNALFNTEKIHNCDDLYNLGYHVDDVELISIGEDVIPVYCEFQWDNLNWLVISDVLKVRRNEITF